MSIARRFAALIDQRKTLAEVVADRGDGTATVTSPSGSDYVVSTGGVSVAPGDKVVVRGGAIETKAPALQTYTVTV